MPRSHDDCYICHDCHDCQLEVPWDAAFWLQGHRPRAFESWQLRQLALLRLATDPGCDTYVVEAQAAVDPTSSVGGAWGGAWRVVATSVLPPDVVISDLAPTQVRRSWLPPHTVSPM